MKRTLSYLLICALTLGLLAGCGAPADAATEQQPADEPTTTTTEQMAQDTVTLDGLTDLLGKTDAELTEMLGEGTENWTSDKSFFIGRTYEVTLEDSAATLYTIAQDDEARTVQSLSVWLSDGSAEVSEETVDGWIDTLTAYIGADAEVSGPSEGGAQTWHWSRDSVYYDLQLLDQILTLSIQAVTGGELQ